MSGGEMTLPDPIAAKWLDLAVTYASGRGYSFAADCLSDLTIFLSNGSRELQTSNRAAEASAHDQDVERLVNYMIDELERQTPGETELHEWTFANARIRLCPLFPFC